MATTDSPDSDYFLALPKGTMLFEYRIESVLGQGGFGITYLAFDTLLNEEVALKEYFPNDTAIRTKDLSAQAKSPHDRETFLVGLDAFLEEARIIARFRHPNIMQVRRFFEAHGTGYIVLQFERGKSFEDLVAGGPIPEAALLPMLADILQGLDVVHERAILHRDIKPRNVIVRDDGTAVLIDFGAARDFTMRNTRTVTKMASPGYSPPEQYGVGNQQGPWSDFYALGAMMYRAVTGKVPADSLRRLRNDPLVPASQAAAGRYGKPLLKMIDRMMQIDESRRPASVAEIRAGVPSLAAFGGKSERQTKALRSALPRDKDGAAEATWSDTSGPRASKRRGLWAGLAVLALLLLGGGITAVLRSRAVPVVPDVPPLTQSSAGTADRTARDAASSHPEPPTALVVPNTPSTQTRTGAAETEQKPAAVVPIFRDCPTCPEVIVLPAGRFLMGADDGFANEAPVHAVEIATPPALGRRPVTFAEWDACVAAGGCERKPDDHGWGRGQRPVIDVSWNDAKAYVAWLARTTGAPYRLPSEAEYEYAARAGTTGPFWWGPDVGDGHANCQDCVTPKPVATLPVASFAANPFGLFDTAGNVAEWVEDCWRESYAQAPADGSSVGTSDCRQRVLRGGSFRSDWRRIRMSARARSAESTRSPAVGFRVARDRPDSR